jgi:hypothetical protein
MSWVHFYISDAEPSGSATRPLVGVECEVQEHKMFCVHFLQILTKMYHFPFRWCCASTVIGMDKISLFPL